MVLQLKRRVAFTLVEVSVVIGILVVLGAMILPAVQYSREAARRVQCSNSIRQLSLAVLDFESNQNHLPSGGWGSRWSGLPTRGTGIEQPGGWIYSVLPYLEQASLHDIGGTSLADVQLNTQRVQTPLAILHCPARRSAELFKRGYPWSPVLHDVQDDVARNDYAINGGTFLMRSRDVPKSGGPLSIAAASQFRWPDMRPANGLSHIHTVVRLSQVSDGLSNTLFVGEKHVYFADYYTGNDEGDNEGAYSGDGLDVVRYGSYNNLRPLPPLSDRVTSAPPGTSFGSAHASGFYVSTLDGAVHFLNFSIDGKLFSQLSARNDAKPTDVQLD